jgi:hypothetical protein
MGNWLEREFGEEVAAEYDDRFNQPSDGYSQSPAEELQA